ncbi:NTP pyrophosphatase (non-canonical NTP hydrolase) [Clostridium punense]|uniref:NTP pyrophosphatase (Non-canonical NTP hydrolase) n=1 Tax=Clostridium punense TaxID=1054297 RepID=A0ABS4K8S6_9CLOT|nr:MazG nucleotide pyrophosphohydrolase domain-containing protein [Clostridium sp. BL8]MBP2024183.1 NTP pyrophosphatase (non-canonical NTP hydrolase) [Clostridium punense]
MNLQHIQELVESFTKSKGMNSDVNVRVIDLASEVGELSKEVLKGTNYGNKDFKKTEQWDSEIGDVLFSLICLANESNTSLEDCLKQVLNKYKERFASSGNMGSGK